jgi:metal-responsive CopG/Arc/MetJ family transcriptional regulator
LLAKEVKMQTHAEVPSKLPQTTVRLEPEVMEELDREAKRVKRSRSNLIAVLIEEALRARKEARDV